MKRFQFELEPVLRHKTQKEREAENRVAHAAARLRAAEHELGRKMMHLEELSAEMARLGLRPVAVWSERFERMIRLCEAVKQAEQAVVDAQATLDQAERERVRIGIEVEALRQLKTQRWQEYQRERDRKRQKDLDDDALRRRMVKSDFSD